MKIYLFIVAAFTSQLPLIVQKNGPVFSAQQVLDYGTVYTDEDSGIRLVEFTNTGNEPLILVNVTTSCGCLVASGPKEPIAAGKSGIIKVKYDVKRLGIFEKSITISTNEGTEKDDNGYPIYTLHVIRVKGKILQKEE